MAESSAHTGRRRPRRAPRRMSASTCFRSATSVSRWPTSVPQSAGSAQERRPELARSQQPVTDGVAPAEPTVHADEPFAASRRVTALLPRGPRTRHCRSRRNPAAQGRRPTPALSSSGASRSQHRLPCFARPAGRSRHRRPAGTPEPTAEARNPRKARLAVWCRGCLRESESKAPAASIRANPSVARPVRAGACRRRHRGPGRV